MLGRYGECDDQQVSSCAGAAAKPIQILHCQQVSTYIRLRRGVGAARPAASPLVGRRPKPRSVSALTSTWLA
jgi:hypothetical protein